MSISVDMGILIALLMKNEDIWLKMPSQKVFDEICLAMELVGIEFEKKQNSIKVISLEGKIEKQKQMEAYKAQIKQSMLTPNINQMFDEDFFKIFKK